MVIDTREARAIAEDAAEKVIKDDFESLCPNVIGNPFIPTTHFPHPPQAVFLGMHLQEKAKRAEEVYECLYGGAAGGGKSDALLMGAAQFAWKHPGFAGVCVRRTFASLNKADALLDRAMKWWLPAGVVWNGTDKKFRFPNGSTVEMTHHSHPKHNENFQGAAYQYVGWDELTHWPDDAAYRWVVFSRMRQSSSREIPIRSLSASNPGSQGHAWVKKRFVGGVDIETGLMMDPVCDFIPASLHDNPSIDQAPYIASLMHLHPTVRAQLLEGDWGAREPGDYFRAEWFGPLLDPEEDAWPQTDKLSVRWWDLAASEKPDACHTAGVLMSRHRSGVRAIEHCTSFKATPGKRDDAIVRQARLDGPRVMVGIEIEPGSGGIAQYEALKKRLNQAGFNCTGAKPKAMSDSEKEIVIRAPTNASGKAVRCAPVASCLYRGYERRGEGGDTEGDLWGLDLGRGPASERDGIRLYVGAWTQAYLDVVEGFPGEGRMDEADATSGAWSWLEAHPWGRRIAPNREKEREVAEIQNVHPSQRPDESRRGRNKSGHWAP